MVSLKNFTCKLIFSIFFMASLMEGSAWAAFYTTETLPEYPVDFERAFSGAIQIDFDGDNWCSAVAISDHGYLLTNLHCLKSCLQLADGIFEDYVNVSESEFYNVWKVKRSRVNGTICRAFFSYNDDAFNYDEPEIIWTGTGKGSFDDARVDEIPDLVYNKMKSQSSDYAILKFKTPYTNIPCVPLSTTDSHVGDKVWSVGFPSASHRGDGFDSDGQGRFISQGVVREKIEDDPVLKNIYKTQLQWQKEAGLFNQSKFLLSSLDSMPGSSGSLIVNENSELTAVLFGKINPSAQIDYGGTAIAVKSSQIYQDVVKGLGKKKAKEIFHCPSSN